MTTEPPPTASVVQCAVCGLEASIWKGDAGPIGDERDRREGQRYFFSYVNSRMFRNQ